MAIYLDCDIDGAARWVSGVIAGFGFDTGPAGDTVGDHSARIVATDISRRGMRGYGPDGEWDHNADSTIKKKGFDAPNVVTGEMLDPKNIAGTVTNSREECRIDYTDDPEIRERAEFAHTGQSRKKIIRRFMGLDEDINRAVVEAVARDLTLHIEHVGGGDDSWG